LQCRKRHLLFLYASLYPSYIISKTCWAIQYFSVFFIILLTLWMLFETCLKQVLLFIKRALIKKKILIFYGWLDGIYNLLLLIWLLNSCELNKTGHDYCYNYSIFKLVIFNY
jgi:hypothetical protein